MGRSVSGGMWLWQARKLQEPEAAALLGAGAGNWNGPGRSAPVVTSRTRAGVNCVSSKGNWPVDHQIASVLGFGQGAHGRLPARKVGCWSGAVAAAGHRTVACHGHRHPIHRPHPLSVIGQRLQGDARSFAKELGPPMPKSCERLQASRAPVSKDVHGCLRLNEEAQRLGGCYRSGAVVCGSAGRAHPGAAHRCVEGRR